MAFAVLDVRLLPCLGPVNGVRKKIWKPSHLFSQRDGIMMTDDYKIYEFSLTVLIGMEAGSARKRHKSQNNTIVGR